MNRRQFLKFGAMAAIGLFIPKIDDNYCECGKCIEHANELDEIEHSFDLIKLLL